MLKLKDNNNGGLMVMEVGLRNGITFKNLEDLVRMQMISIDKQDTHSLQV